MPDDDPHRQPAQPRRRPRQGHRRREVRRRVQRPGPGPRLRRVQRHRPGPDHRRSTPRRRWPAGRAPGLHAREPAAHGLVRPQLPRRGRAARARRSARSTTTRSTISGQPVALVVAETSSSRATPPSLVRVEYEPEAHATDLRCAARRGLRAAEEALRHQPAAEAARRRRRRRFAEAPVRVEAEYRIAGRAPQPDGDVRHDGGLGRRRQAHRLRQDPGRAERPGLPLQRVRALQGRGAGASRRSSAGRSARACGRSTRCSWPSWRRGS